MSYINKSTAKNISLLYLREDQLKKTLNNFFTIYKNIEDKILNNSESNYFGIADIRCILIISINPGITFKELVKKLCITKQSLNRVLKILIDKDIVIQKINKQDKRMKNLYLSSDSIKLIDKIISPVIKEISAAFQISGSNAVLGFNQTFNHLINKDESK